MMDLYLSFKTDWETVCHKVTDFVVSANLVAINGDYMSYISAVAPPSGWTVFVLGGGPFFFFFWSKMITASRIELFYYPL